MKYFLQEDTPLDDSFIYPFVVIESQKDTSYTYMEISEDEVRKIILENIEGVKPIEGQNIMGCSESLYNPYYLVRESLKESKVDPRELSTETLFFMISTADFASAVFF